MHNDDPIRKGHLEHETPSEKQWRDSLIDIEQELQAKFELKDNKQQPSAEQGKVELQDRKKQLNLDKSFNRAEVKKIVEDHWRAILPLRGYGKRAQNITPIEQMGNRFADQIEAWCNLLPPDQAKELDDMFGEEMRVSVAECKRDPVAYARRLGILFGRVSLTDRG